MNPPNEAAELNPPNINQNALLSGFLYWHEACESIGGGEIDLGFINCHCDVFKSK